MLYKGRYTFASWRPSNHTTGMYRVIVTHFRDIAERTESFSACYIRAGMPTQVTRPRLRRSYSLGGCRALHRKKKGRDIYIYQHYEIFFSSRGAAVGGALARGKGKLFAVRSRNCLRYGVGIPTPHRQLLIHINDRISHRLTEGQHMAECISNVDSVTLDSHYI